MRELAIPAFALRRVDWMGRKKETTKSDTKFNHHIYPERGQTSLHEKVRSISHESCANDLRQAIAIENDPGPSPIGTAKTI